MHNVQQSCGSLFLPRLQVFQILLPLLLAMAALSGWFSISPSADTYIKDQPASLMMFPSTHLLVLQRKKENYTLKKKKDRFLGHFLIFSECLFSRNF